MSIESNELILSKSSLILAYDFFFEFLVFLFAVLFRLFTFVILARICKRTRLQPSNLKAKLTMKSMKNL